MMDNQSMESADEQIATVSSPSSTTSLSLEILDDAAKKKLVGELIWFAFEQDQTKHYVLGQITEVELQNYMLEFSEIRSLARQRGGVNPISGVQDTHRGLVTAGSVFMQSDEFYVPSILGTVPPTGTAVYKASDNVLKSLLEQYRDKIFYLGNYYVSKLKLPLWFPHFGRPESGGAGEAYHIGIYGMTGSGKSTLAKTIMIAYMRHQSMAIFVFDPSGEFKKSATGQRTASDGLFVDIKKVAEDFGREVITKNVGDLVLDRWDLFEELIFESDFFMSLTIPAGRENRRTASRLLRENLKSASAVNLSNLHKPESYDIALRILGDETIQTQIYPSSGPRERFAGAVASPPTNLFESHWKPVANLFNTEGKEKVGELVYRTFDLKRGSRPIVIIDLSETGRTTEMVWNNKIKAILINRIVTELKKRGERAYKEDNFLNTLVILDEAQRLVSRERFKEEKQDQLRDNLIDAVQTTRKYGLGWMFISLSLSTLHREIYHENRISFYGFGLNSGSELSALNDLISDKRLLKLYQSFRDPHAVESKFRTYSFMAKGPVSPLSSGNPLFLTMFKTYDEFLRENGINS